MSRSFRDYERKLRRLLKFWAILFGIVAVIFVAIPGQVVEVINQTGALVGWDGPLLKIPADRFYSILAVSLLVVLAVLAHNARQDLRRRLPTVRAIILSKVVTAGCYTIALLFEAKTFGYLVGAVADGTIAIWTYAYYRHVRYVI